MDAILILMIAATSLSAFAAPIGPTSLSGTPPMRIAPNANPPGGPGASPLSLSPTTNALPGAAQRGSLLNMTA
jgi:hypothetical protein